MRVLKKLSKRKFSAGLRSGLIPSFLGAAVVLAYFSSTVALAATDWTVQKCDSTSVGITAPDPANAKLACCIHGWFEPVAGASKLDCAETQTFAGFDDLYNFAPTQATAGLDGLLRPNRLFLQDTFSGAPIPGFYNPQSGLRCNYVDTAGTPITKTITTQYDLFDQAMSLGGVPPGVPKNCTRLIRTAMEVICPPLPSTSIPAWRDTDTAGAVRCSAAATIRFHIAMNDLAQGAIAGRGKYHTVTSYNPSGAGVGVALDQIKVHGVEFWKVIQALHPTGTTCTTDPSGTTVSPGLTYNLSTKRCQIN